MNAIIPIPEEESSRPLADSLLNLVARAMADPTQDVEKLKALLTEQRKIVAEDARLRFSRAMSSAQGEMQAVVRDATNDHTHSKYARLETIDAAIRPVYVRHGFCLEFNSESIEGPNERIVCEVSHSAGHSKKFQLEAAPDTAGPLGKGNKTPLHGLGSTVSYLRRYLVCMIFNIVLISEDNDGTRRQPANDDGRITEREADELHDLMRRGRIHEGTVLEKMAPGLPSISQLPAHQFGKIRNALLSRLNVLDQRTAAARVTGRMMDNYDANTKVARS